MYIYEIAAISLGIIASIITIYGFIIRRFGINIGVVAFVIDDTGGIPDYHIDYKELGKFFEIIRYYFWYISSVYAFSVSVGLAIAKNFDYKARYIGDSAISNFDFCFFVFVITSMIRVITYCIIDASILYNLRKKFHVLQNEKLNKSIMKRIIESGEWKKQGVFYIIGAILLETVVEKMLGFKNIISTFDKISIILIFSSFVYLYIRN